MLKASLKSQNCSQSQTWRKVSGSLIVCLFFALVFSAQPHAMIVQQSSSPELAQGNFGPNPEKAHNCPCGSACKGNCCCADDADDEEPDPESRSPKKPTVKKAMNHCGCSFLPADRIPPPNSDREPRTRISYQHEDACLRSVFSCDLPVFLKRIFAINILCFQSPFDAPPDPPPDLI